MPEKPLPASIRGRLLALLATAEASGVGDRSMADLIAAARAEARGLPADG